MDILRTPDKCFSKIKDYPFEPIYTVIETHDGSDLRIHHIDETERLSINFMYARTTGMELFVRADDSILYFSGN